MNEIHNKKISKFSEIAQRMNLQCIGNYIRDGDLLTQQDECSFTERADKAFEELNEIMKFDEEILEEIIKYKTICENISFSLGMKVGAQLISLLLSNFEADF